MILITCEKLSVAATIAHALGVNKKEDGFYSGNGYYVTWCLGHLVTLAEPEAYGKQYEHKGFDKSLLPIIPDNFKTVVIEDKKKQFNVIKKLMHQSDVEYIIDAGDAGAQGHYLQWLVRQQAGCNKPVKRFLTDDYTDEKIREQMQKLYDISEFTNIIKSEFCKAKEDWMIGMSFSRQYSVPIGRVITPTLNFVVERYNENKNFKPSTYYQVKCTYNEGFAGILYKGNTKEFENKSEAESIAAAVSGKKATVVKLEKKDKIKHPPKLYNIDDLEKDGINNYGYSAEQVLKAAQALYEKHKVITYPRAESNYITSDLLPQLLTSVNYIQALDDKYKNAAAGHKFINAGKRIADASKIEDHHAIIVTNKIKGFDISKLTEIERNVLHMVISRILTALAEDMHYSETLIECRIGDYNTLTKDKFVTSEGYMQIQSALTGSNDSKGSKDRNELILSKDVKVGATLQPATAACTSHLTTPPQLHTEATLLTAMINASNSVDDENEAEVLKESGIGTKATRAGIIKNLFDYGFVEYDGNGKVKHIIPTEKGQEIIAHVEPDLKSAALTAQMQLMLAEVAEGALSEAECMVHITSYIQQLFLKIRSREQWSYQKQYTQESIGRCPYCGGNVLMGQYGMYCEKYKECHFTVSFEKNFAARCAGKALTKTQMKALLDKGLTMTLKSKSGTKYKKIFRINPVWSEQYKSVQIDSDFLK